MPGTIVIVGSMNMDFLIQVARLPQAGETFLGSSFQMLPGGKGANQAYAVGRLGGTAKMVGCVGQDIFGRRLIDNLKSVGVETSGIFETPNSHTGVAFIAVEESGQNQIIVDPGANAGLAPGDISRALSHVHHSFMLIQFEIPLNTAEYAMALARNQKAITVLDPAPAKPFYSQLFSHVDILTPNESEALFLLGRSGGSIAIEEATEVAEKLLKLGPRQVILKLGEKGACYANGKRSLHFPARKVQAVDVTAAGDTFNGALTVALAEQRPIEEAIHFANTAASLSVTQRGAQASIPTREEVEAAYLDYE